MGLTRTAEEAGYFYWLREQVWFPDEGNTYDELMFQLYDTEFVWVIGNDENRIADARELRAEYAQRIPRMKPVSFLEVMIALSKRFEFLTQQPAKDRAWEFIVALKLNRYPDPISATDWKIVRQILETCIWRIYGKDGVGGFFPLEHPQDDQMVVEIWYQMAAYINERRESFDL